MKVKITAEIKDIDKDGMAKVNCKIAKEECINFLLPVTFIAILNAMKDTDKRAFYDAMTIFAEEDMDDAIEFLTGDEE